MSDRLVEVAPGEFALDPEGSYPDPGIAADAFDALPRVAPVDKVCADVEWWTPPEALEPIKRFMSAFCGTNPLTFLDPATDESNPTGATKFYTKADDGLALPWTGENMPRCVFVNPPYGKELREWVRKINEEAQKGAMIVALLPGQRFEQAYWQDNLFTYWLSGICFIRKRVRFIRGASGVRAKSNPYGSMLWIFNAGAYRGSALMQEHLTALGVVIEAPRIWHPAAPAPDEVEETEEE